MGAVSARAAPGHRQCCEAGHCDAFGSPAEAVKDPNAGRNRRGRCGDEKRAPERRRCEGCGGDVATCATLGREEDDRWAARSGEDRDVCGQARFGVEATVVLGGVS